MIVAMTGASGFIGRHLTALLQRGGNTVRALGREASLDGLQDADAVVHLAGEPVAQRWSADVKRRIHDSRITGTRSLVNAISTMRVKPAVLVGASAIGYYGDRGDEELTETSAPGGDFLAQTCVEWERESLRAGELGVRVLTPRFGIVLGSDGGALKQMLGPFKAGVGGPVGSGAQWMSWIHIDDVVGLIEFALRDSGVRGAVNATAPNPVRNSEFAKQLGHALGRPSVVPVPAFGLKLMFGEMAAVILGSQRVIPEAASRAGYSFRYPELGPALRQIVT